MQSIFTVKHYMLFAASVVLLILGYVFLAQGPVDNPVSTSLAPLIIVGVYCVMIPFAIVTKDKQQTKSSKK